MKAFVRRRIRLRRKKSNKRRDLVGPFLQEDTLRAERLAGSGTITCDIKVSDVDGISEAFEPESKLNALESHAVTLG
ncbi:MULTISPECIES: hypothetical protein [Paraburkholderia]|jgi:hypothetical protein|uniref:Uncharacterized protein n=1 Tax=Paraburkholderia hospita TaxID=169430 RepID=A0AAJ5BX38_9BURK|nr:hypothetical protein [Paraburkholderia hospita]EUC19704.1 hypothetical protein PMI06_002163 [Burkholderia sp. BT03]AUT73744.1 hypothetical protein C2L64_36070 [Paraburkholderia hospita]EIM96348.1 hypothetical protein WQE_35031 [Paraburkholderia hospita]OUL78135.1 hypothetical protein CA602_32230 [Paraburkholderia hospita]OUL79347.1 hypothetical protein CA601_34965 [Paraburkholderia hospita]